MKNKCEAPPLSKEQLKKVFQEVKNIPKETRKKLGLYIKDNATHYQNLQLQD